MAAGASRRPRSRAGLAGLSANTASTLVLAGLAVVAAVLIMHEGRGLNFFFDEWDFVLRQRSGVHSLFEPHVGHLSLVPIVIYRILLHTVGLAPYWPYRLVALVLHLVCVWLLFVLARRRVGP